MVFYVFIVAVMNLALGYGLAVYLKRNSRRTTERPRLVFPGQIFEQVRAPAASLPPVAAVANESTLAVEKAAEPSDIPSEADSQRSLLTASLTQLGAETDSYHKELAGVEDRVRQFGDDPQCIRECIADIVGAGNTLLQQQTDSLEQIKAKCAALPEVDRLQGEIQQAVDEQAAQFADSQGRLSDVAGEPDPEEKKRKVLAETELLTRSAHRVRRMLEEALVSMNSGDTSSGMKDTHNKRPTILQAETSLACLQTLMTNLQGEKGQSARQMCVAAIELDQYDELLADGPQLVARILNAIGQKSMNCVTNLTGAGIGGNTLWLLVMQGQRETAHMVERLRQQVEATQFQLGKDSFRVTANCGVLTLGGEETAESLLQQAEAAIQQAKRYGSNRTFLQEGQIPSPVVAPSFAAEDATVAV